MKKTESVAVVAIKEMLHFYGEMFMPGLWFLVIGVFVLVFTGNLLSFIQPLSTGVIHSNGWIDSGLSVVIMPFVAFFIFLKTSGSIKKRVQLIIWVFTLASIISFAGKASYPLNRYNIKETEIVPISLVEATHGHRKGWKHGKAHDYVKYTMKINKGQRQFTHRYEGEYLEYENNNDKPAYPEFKTHLNQLCITLLHGAYGMDFVTDPHICPAQSSAGA